LAEGTVTLGDVLSRLAAERSDRRLVEAPGSLCLTYGEGAERIGRLAAGVARRAPAGSRVVLAVPNGYDQLLGSLAVCRAGAVAVPVNAQMRPEEVEYVVADSGASLVVRDIGQLLDDSVLDDAQIDARRGRPDDVAAIFYTSGTTGRPKGVELTHRSLVGPLALASNWPAGLRRDEMVVALPVAHIMGFSVLLAAAAAGVPAYCLAHFDPVAVLDAIETRRATVFVGVPTMYRMLLEAGAEGRDLRSIRLFGSGADVMPPGLSRRFQRLGAAATLPRLGRSVGMAAFVEGYGMVETGGAVALRVSPPGARITLPGLGHGLGIPLPGCHLRVVDEHGEQVGVGQVGELVVKAPGVLAGYHGDPAATSAILDAEGWLHTGDLARRGSFGLVSFAGRAKDVIKSGGYSVYAVEIERAMEDHPDVLEAAAVGVPDARLGERVGVAVRLRPGATVAEEELLAWGDDHLSAYKRPRVVRVVETLPRTGTDKVAKRLLLPVLEA